jgi:hypothetical protein
MKTIKIIMMVFLLAATNMIVSAANSLTLTATVTDEYNQPIDDANAVLIHPDTRQVFKAASKSTEGSYVFEGLSSGDYILSISTPDKKFLETEKVVLNEKQQKMTTSVLIKSEAEKVALAGM